MLFNVNHDAPNHDELRLNRIAEPFPFLWVAASARGTVVKIDTRTGQILGEYLSAPNGRGRNPSRTTVDLNGNVWVGNRDEGSGGQGSVVHIGLKEAFQCVDRNGNGVIDTSTGLGDIRPWPNTGSADDNGGVSTAADECIIHYVRVNGTATRTVAITPENDLWVGGWGNRRHDLLDGETGAILDSIAPSCGGYGGLVDRHGVLWSASGLLRYDPRTGQMDCLAATWNSYGLGLDSQGKMWNTQADAETVTVLSPAGEILDVFPTGGSVSTGLAITPDDHVWIANRGPHTVTRLSNEGDLLATIPVGNTPTGVAVDAAGKVWVTNLGSSNVMRIDPATNKVDLTVSLGAGAGPYNYSDMTGALSLGKTAPQGRWTVNHDSSQAGTMWGRVRWSSYEPPGSSVTVRARSAESVGALSTATFADVAKGIEIGVPDGRYLQVEVTLLPSPAGETPIVYDVTAETRSGLPDLTASFVRTVHHADSIELTVRVGNGGDAKSPAGTPVSLYDGDPAAGGTLISTFTDLFPLAPGEYQDVPFLWTSPLPGAHQLHLIANDDGTAQNRGPVEECTRANNTQVVEVAPLPDLVIPRIDRTTAATDLQALTITGTLGIELKNQGNTGVADPFRVTVFVDLDRDGRLTAGTDRVLGQADFTDGLAAGASATVPVPVAGDVRFRDDLIWAFVDSADVIPELSEDNNLNQTGAACDFRPPAGTFSPQVEWQWTGSQTLPSSNQVMMTPAVIDLTGDGVPEVVFTTYQGANYNTDGHLRAVDGRTGAELFTVTDPVFDVRGAGSVAVGDIDLDGQPEILAVAESADRLLAFEHDGTFKWRSAVNPGAVNWGGPALADLDRDGLPEIVAGATVFDRDGSRRWVGGFGRGDNASAGFGPLSLVADLDLSGNPEVVAGNTAYRSDGTVLWRRSDVGDGFNAVGNFDADPFPEVVLVTGGRVYLLQHDGTTVWGPVLLPGGGHGGAPTVADVDGDGQPEIGVAGNSRYVVFETNGTIKWQAATQDGSSQITGSSVFDFEGDGSAEVVYGDERFLRIYRGSDGTVLYQLAKSSGTTYELPVVADVDADGNAEIVAVANTLVGFGPQNGVYVIGDANDSWLPTRKLWNQHTYHVTNVNDDGSIPRQEEPSWLAHNTYRLNLRTDGDALAAPDLTASRIVVDLANPGVEVPMTARIGNGGKIFAPAGVPVAFYNGDPAVGGTLLGTVATTRRLEPAEFEDVTFVWRTPAPGTYTVFVVADPGTGRGKVSECDEANNRHSLAFEVPTIPDLALTKDDGRPSAVPGQTITYTLTVRNVGTRDATGVALTDALPQNTTFVSASDGGALAAGTVTWPACSLASGASVTRTLTVRINRPLPPGVTAITNQAAVADDGTGGLDPTPGNNTAIDVDSLRNAPEAVDDAATTPEDTAVEIDLFANDSDADGDPLSLAELTQPAHGTVTVVTPGDTGRVMYTPAASFHGTDTFTYTVSDGTGGSDDATVTVTVTSVNDPPMANNDLGETDRDVPLVLSLLANDSDLDGDALSFLVPPHPFGGTLTLNPDGTQTYTPAPGFVGVDVFVYTITDGNEGGTDSATVTINVKQTDVEPPSILITGVTNGECRNQDVTPVITVSGEPVASQSVMLDGQPFESGTPVTADGDYTLVATATDEAGNTGTETVTFTIDKTAPAIFVTGVPDNQCMNVPVTPVFVAADEHLGVVSSSLGGVAFPSGTVVSADGDYTLAIDAADTCGNSVAETLSWIIDTVPPAIAVTGVPEGQVVNADVTPVIDVADLHLGPVAITLDGMPFTSGTAVSAEGDHTLRIEAADTCGNRSERTLTFTIDRTPPAIEIAGVMDGACGNTDVTPVVTVSDGHPASLEITLNGVPFESGTLVTAEGDYILVAVAVDAAGNTARQERRFTIDRTAPSIALEGVTDGVIANTPVTPVLSATDLHLGTVAATLNGQPFTSGTAVAAEGDYTLVVTATDTCGNSSSQTVRFTIDTTPPVITITGVPVGCVNADIMPVFSATDVHLDTVAATLDGQLFTSGTAVTAEGDFTLRIAAADRAGNSSTETRTFTIDRTAPAITLAGVTDGAIVNTDLTPVFSASDAHLNAVTATLNGAPFTSGTALTVDGDYVLVVTATDGCGNSSSQTVRFTIDKTPQAITITGVPEGCLNTDVTPVFKAEDAQSLSATLNGQPFASGTAVTVEGGYTLRVEATDAAGNTSTETRTFTIDKTAPAITLAGAADGAIVNTDVTTVFSATDLHLGAVTATLNGAPFTSGTAVSAEGIYMLVITATDTCGNSSSRTMRFTIDRTRPVITIAGVPEGCVNVDVTPAFTVTDLHPDTVTATLNGQPFTSGTAITAEGGYVLRVVATDAAGNTSTETRTFTIDETAPALTVTGAADGAIVNTDVTSVFSATDLHLSAVTATLNGAPFTSGTAVSAAGSYTLIVTATDTCGNSSSQTVRFTIDTTPPVITVAGVPQGCTNADVTPIFSATDIHLDTVTATLNGQPFTSGTPVTAEGDHTLRIETTDRAGNSSMEVRTFTIDKVAPGITLTGVTDGAIVTTNVTPVFSATDPRLDRVTATLNGAPFASGTVVSAAGDYTLAVTATDICGNNSMLTVRFTVVGPCELYPIALHTSTLAGVEPGATLPDVFNGSQRGHFGWLTWTGASGVPSLVDSLMPPGNSGAYTNPSDSSDHVVSVGDQVQGRPGVGNASGVRDALDTLKTRDIIVPVWDTATGSGSNTLYRVVGFARIRILDYRLPGDNRITARFLGLARCGG